LIGTINGIDIRAGRLSSHCLRWAPQLDALAAAGWRAILPDLAGHGLSAAMAEPTTGQFAGDVVVLLDALGPAAPVCGLSLGGMVAQQTVLAVAGEVDPLAAPPLVEQVAALVPGARFEVVAGAWHLVNLERPDRFNELPLGLLAGLAP
jgi:pimeloyl-ACP methyl ester carboxylesterase